MFLVMDKTLQSYVNASMHIYSSRDLGIPKLPCRAKSVLPRFCAQSHYTHTFFPINTELYLHLFANQTYTTAEINEILNIIPQFMKKINKVISI